MTREELEQANKLLINIGHTESRIAQMKAEVNSNSQISVGYIEVKKELESKIYEYILELHEDDLKRMHEEFFLL